VQIYKPTSTCAEGFATRSKTLTVTNDLWHNIYSTKHRELHKYVQ